MTPEYFMRVAGLAALLITPGYTSTPDPERLMAPTPTPIRSHCQSSRGEALVDGVVTIGPARLCASNFNGMEIQWLPLLWPNETATTC